MSPETRRRAIAYLNCDENASDDAIQERLEEAMMEKVAHRLIGDSEAQLDYLEE